MLSFKKINDNYPWDLLLDADPCRELVEEYLEKGECWAGRENENSDTFDGVYILLFPEEGEGAGQESSGELINLAVRPELQGRGIGKQCVAHAAGRCRLRGLKYLEVGTGNSGIGQIAFYQKCGFRITGVIPDYFEGRFEEEIFENGMLCRDMVRFRMEL